MLDFGICRGPGTNPIVDTRGRLYLPCVFMKSASRSTLRTAKLLMRSSFLISFILNVSHKQSSRVKDILK